MSSQLLVMEAANLFCGDHDPTASKHLTLSELQLPMLQEMFADHHAGGSRVKIEIPVGIEKLEPTFKLVGWDPDLLSQFGLGTAATKNFTAYGSLRDKKTGTAVGAKAIIEGRIGKIEAEAFKRGELQSHDYAINGVTHYELWVDGKEKVFWDFYTNDWRIDGVSQNSDERRLLNLPL
jgi:P2 family phage contractile tail tube protein